MPLTRKTGGYLVAACAICALGYFGYELLTTARVDVGSTPPGAEVRIDGKLYGITPLHNLEVDPGTRRLTLDHRHFASYESRFEIASGERVKRHIELQLGTAKLSLLSNPKGAWVEIDGERIDGTTPLQVEVEAGLRDVHMGMAERRGVRQTVELSSDGMVEVNFNLNIDPHGTLTITTIPRDAQVHFPGTNLTYTPKMRIPVGEYAVHVSRPGYLTQQFRYDVKYEASLHSVTLERAYGELTVRVTPADAEVRVAYRDQGRWFRKTYRPDLRIPVGTVEATVRAMGHRSQHRQFQLPVSGHRLQFNLAKMDVKVGARFRDRLRNGHDAPELIVIPPGSFLMGNDDGPPSERPARRVSLTQPFAVGVHEISIGDYLEYVSSTGGSLPKTVNADQTNYPMQSVTWDEAIAYGLWLSEQTGEVYRLPSEAEWEYVARGQSKTPYYFGSETTQICSHANVADKTAWKTFREWQVEPCEDGYVRTAPVGSFQANPFGVYDIYGNVSEWVAECGMPEYASAPTDGSIASDGENCRTHSFRGGSWDSTAVEVASNYRNTGAARNDDRGFRLVREL